MFSVNLQNSVGNFGRRLLSSIAKVCGGSHLSRNLLEGFSDGEDAMRKSAAALLAILAVTNRGNSEDSAKAIVEKAIVAHGGFEKLSKYPAMRQSATGVIFFDGIEVRASSNALWQLPSEFWVELSTGTLDHRSTVTRVLNGTEAWEVLDGKVRELKGVELDSMKDGVYQCYLESLVPLVNDKQVNLRVIPDEIVSDKRAHGVRVSVNGHNDRELFFDVQSALLVKCRCRLVGRGAAVSEMFYSDYKPVNGLMEPMKLVLKTNGEIESQNTITNDTPLERIEHGKFARPK
jgi:hypothetical protein